MKTHTLLLIALLISIIYSCKKEDPLTLPEEDVLCDGKKEYDGYFPLTIGNQWVYLSSDGSYDTLKITGYEVVMGLTYFKAIHSISGVNENRYFRYDSNGNIYELRDWTEFHFLPNYCQNSQQLGIGHSLICNYADRIVIDINTEIATTNCNYKNIVSVSIYQSNFGTITEGVYYIKKGLGIVHEKFIINGMEREYTLISANIK